MMTFFSLKLRASVAYSNWQEKKECFCQLWEARRNSKPNDNYLSYHYLLGKCLLWRWTNCPAQKVFSVSSLVLWPPWLYMYFSPAQVVGHFFSIYCSSGLPIDHGISGNPSHFKQRVWLCVPTYPSTLPKVPGPYTPFHQVNKCFPHSIIVVVVIRGCPKESLFHCVAL